MSKNTQMYLEFFKKSWGFRKEISQHQSWMKRYAEKQGYQLNPHRMYLTNLTIWLEENKRLYSQQICPCFEASGDPSLDKKLVCPCTFCADDIAQHGSCHCGLFGRGDFTEEDFKNAERHVMTEYRIPLKWDGNALDTRGQALNPLRDLPVPDAMHQFKQARNERPNLHFEILCDREQSAKNIKDYIAQDGIDSHIVQDGENVRLIINPLE